MPLFKRRRVAGAAAVVGTAAVVKHGHDRRDDRGDNRDDRQDDREERREERREDRGPGLLRR